MKNNFFDVYIGNYKKVTQKNLNFFSKSTSPCLAIIVPTPIANPIKLLTIDSKFKSYLPII